MNYSELKTLIDAYVNRNGVQAITGSILNGVLNEMVDQLGRGYQIMGVAEPTDDPGLPDGPECWFAGNPGTYTNFGGITVIDGEIALLCYDTGWTKRTFFDGFANVEATVDSSVGTPTASVSYEDGTLTFTFSNLKGDQGNPAEVGEVTASVDNTTGTPEVTVTTSGPDTAKNIDFDFKHLKGETGDAAGFGTVSASVDGNVGTPSVTVSAIGPDTAKEFSFDFKNLKGEQGAPGTVAAFNSILATVDDRTGTPGVDVLSSGPDTAKDITFRFTNLKGEQGIQGLQGIRGERGLQGEQGPQGPAGVQSAIVSVDNNTGVPYATASVDNGVLTISFFNLKGDQGNTGSSVDYPYELVNNLTTDDATKGLTAAMGVQLDGEISQLDHKLIEIFAFATSKPAGIGDGEVYYHTTDKLLYQAHTGSSSTVVPFYDGAIYTYDNKLYIWDGTNLIPVAEEIKKDKVWSFYFKGEGAVSFKSTIQLIENHLYRFSFPIKWAHTTIVNNIIGIYDGSDTLVWGLASNLEIPNDVLIRANQYPLYDIYLRADSGEVGYVVVEDITETYTINEENKDDITYMYAIGSIKNNANIGSVCPMEEDADTAWRKLVLPVKEGQFFVFNIQGSTNYLPAVFVDDNNIVIDKTSSNAVRQLMVVPKGATKLVSTFSPSRAGYVYRYGCYDRLEKHSSLSKVASLFGKELKDKTLLGSIINNAQIGSKPTLEVDTTDPKWRYIEVDVISGERFKITGRAGSGARLWAILDSEGYLLSVSPANANVESEEIVIPISGTKLICNFWTYSGDTYFPYSLIGGINNPFTKQSPFYKDVNFGVVPTDDYVGCGDNYLWGSSSITTSDVYDKFDSFINTSADISDRNTDVNDGYIYRQKIGNASDGQPLVMYEFKPNIAYGNNNPKIFAICGQHGFEKQSTFGMWYLLNDVINNTRNSPVAKYIREFVHLYIVPVANPSGWDINDYVNSNGVNLNRNWYVNGWTKVTSPASEVTGDEPFDQPETAAMRDAIDGIGGVFLLMDCHQNGSGVVTTDNINWLDITKVNDDYYNETLNASIYEISAITRLFRNLYQEEIGGTNDLCGRIGNPLPSGKGYADLWAVEQRNIIGITHEGFGGFPLGTVNNPNSHKANSELLGNYIKNFLGYYCRI